MRDHIAHAAIGIVPFEEPGIDVAGKSPDARRGNSEHADILAPEMHEAACDVRIRAEVLAPNLLAENHTRRPAYGVIRNRRKHGRQAKHPEEIQAPVRDLPALSRARTRHDKFPRDAVEGETIEVALRPRLPSLVSFE